jgi:hypothetical protein
LMVSGKCNLFTDFPIDQSLATRSNGLFKLDPRIEAHARGGLTACDTH